MKKLFIFYILTLIALAVFSYAFIDANLVYFESLYSGFATQHRELTTILYGGLLTLLFVFYVLILRLVVIPADAGIQKREAKRAWIPGLPPGMTPNFILIVCLILIFSYPAMLSFDIFNYMTTAKVLYFYGENPYLVMPVEFPGDPFLLYTHAANKFALYGPGWLAITGIPYVLGLGNFFMTVLSFKLVAALAYLGVAVLLWKMTKHVFPVALFALNPLVIIETLVSGHNDIVMMFLVLLSYYLIKKKRYIIAIVLFVLSILIKYATIFLVPIFVYMLWKTYRHKEIDWQKIYVVSLVSMLAIFLLSPLREEMYPWYAIWFLPFVSLLSERRKLVYLAIALSFGLMLRYIPFMYSGTHFGMTPVLRVVLAALPVVIVGSVLSFPRRRESRKRWLFNPRMDSWFASRNDKN